MRDVPGDILVIGVTDMVATHMSLHWLAVRVHRASLTTSDISVIVDMRIDMYKDMCIHLYTDMCIDMCMDMCIGMYIDM